jgi:hypothetical protein
MSEGDQVCARCRTNKETLTTECGYCNGGVDIPCIRAVPYEEARLDHFKATREKREKTLHWWKYQKPYKQYDLQTIQEMCSELGREIGYLDDVIELLERTEEDA